MKIIITALGALLAGVGLGSVGGAVVHVFVLDTPVAEVEVDENGEPIDSIGSMAEVTTEGGEAPDSAGLAPSEAEEVATDEDTPMEPDQVADAAAGEDIDTAMASVTTNDNVDEAVASVPPTSVGDVQEDEVPVPQPRMSPADSAALAQVNIQLARIYAAMKADEAAGVLMQLEDREIEGILMSMPERKAAPILAAMDPERAASISRRVLGGGQ